MTLQQWMDQHPETTRTDTSANRVEVRGTEGLDRTAREQLSHLSDFAVMSWGLTDYQLVRYTRLV